MIMILIVIIRMIIRMIVIIVVFIFIIITIHPPRTNKKTIILLESLNFLQKSPRLRVSC